MFDLNTVKLDPARLAGGSWWRIWGEAGRIVGEPTDDLGCAAVLIVPKGIAFHIAKSESEAPHRGRTEKPTNELLQQIHGRALGASVLRGWRNLSVGGSPIEWSEAASIDLMTSPQWRALYEFVDLAGDNRSVALAREENEAKGN